MGVLKFESAPHFQISKHPFYSLCRKSGLIGLPAFGVALAILVNYHAKGFVQVDVERICQRAYDVENISDFGCYAAFLLVRFFGLLAVVVVDFSCQLAYLLGQAGQAGEGLPVMIVPLFSDEVIYFLLHIM